MIKNLHFVPRAVLASGSALVLAFLLFPISSRAAGLTASDGADYEYFGSSLVQSGSFGLVGAHGDDDWGYYSGSAYLFRGLDTATGNVTQNAKLLASDGAVVDRFGYAVSVSGHAGLIGAYGDGDKGMLSGSAYIFRGLDTAMGTVNQNAKLLASDGAEGDEFGSAVSLSGSAGLVGAHFDDDMGANSGSAYIFRSLDTATGTVSENAKLTASDGAAYDEFGHSVSLSGSVGLVGAHRNDQRGSNSGAAYLFRSLDTATGNVTENAKLTASDGAVDDEFGYSVSVSGNMGLVGAYGDDDKGTSAGAAYIFRGLDTATGDITENAKLLASDGAAFDSFGTAVSLSGNVAVVGAAQDSDKGASSGSAYIYRNLDTATGTVTESVKILASDGADYDTFGTSVSVDGDNFLIGASGKNSSTGKAYSGSVSSMTVLDAGNTSRAIDGISFVSQEDWIIGSTTDNNTVHLTAGDTATLIDMSKAIFIGENAGSDDNTLIISGGLAANAAYIGSTDGNAGNTLRMDSTGSFTFASIELRLANDNTFSLEGDYTDSTHLFTYLGYAKLQVWDPDLELWTTVTTDNVDSLIESTYSSGYTDIQAIPEPGVVALVGLGVAALLLHFRRVAASAP